MSSIARREAAERLSEWFEIQLAFANVVAAHRSIPFDRALSQFTNLRRRFGFGRFGADADSPDQWRRYLEQLQADRALADQVSRTIDFAAIHLSAWNDLEHQRFGCFSFESRSEGVIRIHFSPCDRHDGPGPLSRQRMPERTADLTRMFAYIRAHCDEARTVAGGSWLYNLDAYKRLFPPDYVNSLAIRTLEDEMSGGSWWGQFIDHSGGLLSERVKTFKARLQHYRGGALRELFPFPPLTAHVSVQVFFEFFRNQEN